MKRIYILFCSLCVSLVAFAQVEPHPAGVPLRTTDPGVRPATTEKLSMPVKNGGAAMKPKVVAQVAPMKAAGAAPKTMAPPQVAPLKTNGSGSGQGMATGGNTTGTMAAMPATGQMNPAGNGAAGPAKTAQPTGNLPSSTPVKKTQVPAPAKPLTPAGTGN